MIRNFNFEPQGMLVRLQPDFNGPRVSSVSLTGSLRYDTRNSLINPTSGRVAQVDMEYAPRLDLNKVSFFRCAFWFQQYSEVLLPELVLAFRLGCQGIEGDALPVHVLTSLGGNKDLRGSPQDRYLDRVSGVCNAEIRFPVYRRLGGVAGLDAGRVWRSFRELGLDHFRANPTAGLRLHMETLVVRLDVGWGKKTTRVYFNFGHIF